MYDLIPVCYLSNLDKVDGSVMYDTCNRCYVVEIFTEEGFNRTLRFRHLTTLRTYVDREYSGLRWVVG